MCDTQVLRSSNGIWFAKNSDREPHEPQAVVQVPAVRGDRSTRLRVTHIEIPQVPDRHAVILSKPCWIWGAEMGINEHGLVIGNEAIFSHQRSLTPALLGMDLLRLALERARDARAAIEVITSLLEQHGQGGPAGHRDKGFHYDSSFILADPQGAWVLETAGRAWAARPVEDYAAISNALSLEENYSLCSTGVSGSFRKQDTRLLPWFAGSHRRRSLSLQCLARTAADGPADFATLAGHLRAHRRGNESPLEGSNGDVCMHASGPIRRSQTTGSLIAWLGPQGPRLAVTGTSAPCLSLFRPLTLGVDSQVLAPAPDQAPLWQAWEAVHRAALFDADYRARLRQAIADIEAEVLASWMLGDADFAALDARCEAFTRTVLNWSRPDLPRGHGIAARLWRQTA